MADHFVMFPVSENGVFLDPAVVRHTLVDAMSAPFSFTDIFIYAHGWWVSGNSAMTQYSVYSMEFTRNLIEISASLPRPPQHSFGIGIHWPSILGEVGNFLEQTIRPVTYYAMEARALQVGSTGLYATLMVLLTTRWAAGQPFRLTLVGHSFGCNVLCSALQRLFTEITRASADPLFRQFVLNLQINLVLLQAAFKQTEFDVGGDFESLSSLPNIRILATTSQLDRALNYWFNLAEEISNIVHPFGKIIPALGAGVPPLANIAGASAPGGGLTPSSIAAFNVVNGGLPLQIAAGFISTSVPPLLMAQRFLVADLTRLHSDRIVSGDYVYSQISGSHSDISSTEIYNLIAGFCFQEF